jgi:hypothetical protein
MKVYCSECDHYIRNYRGDDCSADGNLIFTDTYVMRVPSFISKPEIINERNNCGWYEPKVYNRVGAGANIIVEKEKQNV